MDPCKAKQILEALLSGAHPITGEELAEDGVWNEAQVIRALHLAITALDPAEKTAKPRTPSQKGERTGKPWTAEEDAQLQAEFSGGMTVAEMALQHGRTTGGITSRLVRLGVIIERSDANKHNPQLGTSQTP